MNHPEVVIIVARADNGVIGVDGQLPWHISADLRRFKSLTMGMPMIMGRKTFDSLPGLLPGRRHIVLTRDSTWEEEGAEPVASAEEALKIANAPHVAIIGGAEIIAMFLPIADRVELTEVHARPEGDTKIKPLGKEWRETFREDHAEKSGQPGYSFVTLVRA